MALPKDIPTLKHKSSESLTRPDNIFVSMRTHQNLIKCYTDPAARGPGADHFPILTILDTTVDRKAPKKIRNFRMTDWKKFNKKLGENLQRVNVKDRMEEDEIKEAVSKLTGVIVDTIAAEVPESVITSHSRRWWTKDLDEMKKKYNKFLRESFKHRNEPGHISHSEAKTFGKEY
ncbi:hypothetical protein BDN72DRAFT_748771, partial [Pluteus cervinus]